MPPTPRRLALVGPVYPYRGGIAHTTEAMLRGLRARGHELLAVNFSRQYPGLLFPGKTQYEELRAVDDVGAERRLDSIGPWSWWSTARRIAAWRPDAVVFMYWMPFFAPAYAAVAWWLRRRGAKVLAVVHNALPHERRPLDRTLAGMFLRQCDGVLALSDQVSRDLAELGATASCRRVHLPVFDHFGEAIPREEARRQLGLPPDRPLMLFFGYVRAYKGLGVLLDAMPAVRAAVPDATLAVCGEFYEDEAAYRAQLERLGLGDAVRLHNQYLPTEEVGRWFCAADVVVQPYVGGTQSGVAQVAFHFGRAVVLTDVGGLAEVVPHERAGFVVPPGDPGALAAAIVRFFAEGWRERLEEGVARERVKYSWDRLHEAVEELADPVAFPPDRPAC